MNRQEKMREYRANYKKTAKGKATEARYRNSEKGKACDTRYLKNNPKKRAESLEKYKATGGRLGCDLRRYNLSADEYGDLLEEQLDTCALCRKKETALASNGSGEIRRLSVDHDHKCCPTQAKCCGKCIRGLLCARCNVMLGHFEKSGLTPEDLFSYLNKRSNTT